MLDYPQFVTVNTSVSFLIDQGCPGPSNQNWKGIRNIGLVRFFPWEPRCWLFRQKLTSLVRQEDIVTKWSLPPGPYLKIEPKEPSMGNPNKDHSLPIPNSLPFPFPAGAYPLAHGCGIDPIPFLPPPSQGGPRWEARAASSGGKKRQAAGMGRGVGPQ